MANYGFQDHIIKATLFFSGQSRDGSDPYGCGPASNLSLYTLHSSDSGHLNWSANPGFRPRVLQEMLDAGVNVAVMSSWGESFLACSSAWVPWAPMQVSPQSHDELFEAAANTPVLILPYLESHGYWQFYNDFPTSGDGRVSPGTVSQVADLVNRYVRNPARPEWSNKWARVYDVHGEDRYAVGIIHASSNRLGPSDHALYAAGFGAVAQEVFAATGVKVGFWLDALPADTWAPGVFKPSPESTGVYLRAEPAVLGIMCFIREIWLGSSDDGVLLAWKDDFSRRWFLTGIPFLMDVSPGYDAHLVFPGSVRYGLNPQWTSTLGRLVKDFGHNGLIFNSWNG